MTAPAGASPRERLYPLFPFASPCSLIGPEDPQFVPAPQPAAFATGKRAMEPTVSGRELLGNADEGLKTLPAPPFGLTQRKPLAYKGGRRVGGDLFPVAEEDTA